MAELCTPSTILRFTDEAKGDGEDCWFYMSQLKLASSSAKAAAIEVVK